MTAFQEFRDQLLLLGYGMKCNDARLNAVRSQMMAATDQVYLVEMGKQARMQDRVLIFDYADIACFPDKKERTAFVEQWRRSLQHRK